MTSNRNRSWLERHPGIGVFSILLFLFTLLDLGGTTVVRLLSPSASYISYSEREKAYRASHPVYHHDLIPGVEVDNALWGPIEYRIRTNSLGMKDATRRDIPLELTTRRIVLIGDSFVEGIGYAFEETFAGILAAKLSMEGVDLLNGSVSSYSPIIYLRKIEYLLEIGFRFDHLFVFIDLSDMEDEVFAYEFDGQRNVVSKDTTHRSGVAREESAEQFQTVFHELKDFLVRNTTVFGRSYLLMHRHFRANLEWTQDIDRRRSSWTSDASLFEEFGREGQQLAARHMSALRSIVDRHEIEMTLIVYPWPHQIRGRESDSRHVEFWKTWATANEVVLIDLFPAFLSGGDPEDTIEAYFIPGNAHWNAAGHKKVAELLRPHLR